jgi:hypothetical protein
MDVAACAVLAHRHFTLLAAMSPHLGEWCELGYRKPCSPKKVDVGSEAALERLLSKGVNRRDLDNAPIPELGWSLSLWNGDAGGWPSGTGIHCGMTSRNRNLSNSANVSIDGELDASLILGLFRGLIETWSPDSGFVRQYEGKAERDCAFYRTSFPARFWGPGKRFAQGRLLQVA